MKLCVEISGCDISAAHSFALFSASSSFSCPSTQRHIPRVTQDGTGVFDLKEGLSDTQPSTLHHPPPVSRLLPRDDHNPARVR